MAADLYACGRRRAVLRAIFTDFRNKCCIQSVASMQENENGHEHGKHISRELGGRQMSFLLLQNQLSNRT